MGGVLALLIVVGLVIGLAIGSLGGGGSIIAVPVLVYLFDQDTAEATTGSLVVVGITAALGAWAHRRSGRVRLRTGVVFGFLGVAGSYVGSRLSVAVPDAVLLALFSVLLAVVAGLMTRRRRRAAGATGTAGAAAPALPEPAPPPLFTWRSFTCDWRRLGLVLGVATAVGLLTGFFGVGGGFAVVPALALVLELPMPVAIGTSLVVITINSASAFASRLAHPVDLDVGLLATFTVAAVVGSQLGVRVVGRVSPVRLNAAFSMLLVLVAAYTAVRSAAALL